MELNYYQKSQQLLQKARTLDAWALTYVKNYSSFEDVYPFYCKSAHGAYLWDVDNNKYIDYTLGYGTIILGHADKRVNASVIKEIRNATCVSPLWKPIQVELAELLTSVIPKAEMAFFMKTGSDATSGALRLARVYTQRNKVIRWGYNGWHDWCTPRPKGVPESIRSDVMEFTYNDVESLEKLFLDYPDQIACVLMMPFEIEKPCDGFLQKVKEIAHQNGALLILDEMRSGFRFALGGAQEYFGIQADLATYSKAMSNGYPISAIVGKKDIFQCMEQTKMTATFFGSSLEMVAAYSTISILKNTNVIPYIWHLGMIFLEGLNNIINELSIEAEVVGYPPFPYIRFIMKDQDQLEKAKRIFYSETTKKGILFHPNHHWYICGSHKIKDINNTLDICREAFSKVKVSL